MQGKSRAALQTLARSPLGLNERSTAGIEQVQRSVIRFVAIRRQRAANQVAQFSKYRGLRIKFYHEVLHESSALEALARSSTRKLCTKFYTKLRIGSPLYSRSLYTCLCQVYPYIATYFLTHPSFLTSSLPRKPLERQPAEGRRQNQDEPLPELRRTVARTRRPTVRTTSSERANDFTIRIGSN